MTSAPIAAPQSAAEVSEIAGRADEAGEKIAIAGGGTLAGMGLPPRESDLVLSTQRLRGVVEYERADLTIAVRAGTALAKLSAQLAAAEQFVPFDAPRAAHATVGGTLAAGWLGPRRHLYGRLREYVIGSTVVLADGSIARAGGMVVKNVAGYDMSRLYVGSFGTLGVIVQANFKTAPLPRRARLFLAPLPERTRSRACAALELLQMRPAAAFWIGGFRSLDGDDGAEGRLAVLFEGSDGVVERASRDVRSALGRAGVPETRVSDAGARESFARIVDAYVACVGERTITYRITSFPQDSLERALRAGELARQHGLGAETIVDVMNGDVVLRAGALDVRAFGAKVEGFDDALREIEPAAEILASGHPHRVNLRPFDAALVDCAQSDTKARARELMRALKRRFDPKGTFNSGRFLGGI